jgi:hypothetical protein
MLVTPTRIELTSMMDLMQGKKPLLWRAEKVVSCARTDFTQP